MPSLRCARGEVERDLRPFAFTQARYANVIVVVRREAVVLEDRLGRPAEVIAEYSLLTFPIIGPGTGFMPVLSALRVAAGLRPSGKRRRIAGVLWGCSWSRPPKPGIVRRLPLKVARRPDAVRKVRRPFCLSFRNACVCHYHPPARNIAQRLQ